jgi:hypothetical protein
MRRAGVPKHGLAVALHMLVELDSSPACQQIHFINPATGKVVGDEQD